jgi:hypothetical protein
MSQRGLSLQRVADYFRNAGLDEASITLQYVTGLMHERVTRAKAAGGTQARLADVSRPKRTRNRKQAPPSADTPGTPAPQQEQAAPAAPAAGQVATAGA